MVFKFLAKLLHERDDRHRGRVPQWAERASEHVFCEILNIVDILPHSSAFMESDQCFLEPVSAFAAWDAPSAALVLIELDRAERKFHNAGRVVEYNDAAGSKHRAGFRDGIKIHSNINLRRQQNGHRGAPRAGSLQLPAVRDAA